MKNSWELIFLFIHIFNGIVTVQCEDENYFEDPLNAEEIIDPHSFFYDKQSKTMIKETQVAVVTNTIEEDNLNHDEMESPKSSVHCGSHEIIFYKRLINLLLSNINIKEKNEESITGALEIEVSHSQMEILKNFNVRKTSLREIDEILSNIIKKPQYSYMDGVMYVFDILQIPIGRVLKTVQEHPDGAIILFAMLMVCQTLRMIRWGQRLPIFTIIQVIFVLSFFMTWWQLIQEAEIKYTAAQMKFSSIPISCQPHKMNFWDKFVSFFSEDDCEQYYRTVLSNSKLKVTPAFALSHFISTVVLHPVTHVGTVISHFISNATDNLPWTYAWIVRCMLFLCLGLVILMIPFCLSGASFNLGLGPLLRFGISYQKDSEKGNSLHSIEKREPVQIILKVSQGTEVPQVKSNLEDEQSRALQVLKHDREEDVRTDWDSQNRCEDLSDGDTVKNTEPSESDDIKECTKLHAMKTKNQDGSGDS